MSKIYSLTFGLLLVSAFPTAHAEVISIADPRYNVANDPSGVVRPTQGMSMEAVKAHYGEPASKTAAVGEPPITRWNYAKFSVYFEHNTVLHSVVARDAK